MYLHVFWGTKHIMENKYFVLVYFQVLMDVLIQNTLLAC